MFKIRREQMEAFRAEALRDFEEQMVAHLAAWLPERVAALGEPAVRDLVREGIRRAARHGIVAERDVCKFVDVMLALGPTFDEEPWALAVLGSERRTSQSKMDEILELAAARTGWTTEKARSTVEA
jgi:hypothetical protein